MIPADRIDDLTLSSRVLELSRRAQPNGIGFHVCDEVVTPGTAASMASRQYVLPDTALIVDDLKTRCATRQITRSMRNACGRSSGGMMKKYVVAVLSLIVIASTATAKQEHKIKRHKDAVPGWFMVVLDQSIPLESYDSVSKELQKTYKLNISVHWGNTRAFLCEGLSEEQVAQLSDDPRVLFIEEDFEYFLSGMQYTYSGTNYLWHLDRLDESNWFDNTSTTQPDSTYDMCPQATAISATPSEIVAYVVDTGVSRTHEQFTMNGSRLLTDYFCDTTGCAAENVNTRCNPGFTHGTAVASVLAGATIGAAKPYIVSLRTTQCATTGRASAVVSAVNWIRSANDPYRNNKIAVVNYSGGLGNWLGEFSTLNTAVWNLVYSRGSLNGIPFFTSADNFSGDSCLFSPNAFAYTNTQKSGRYVFSVGGSQLRPIVNNPNTFPREDRMDSRWATTQTNPQDSGSNGGACVSAYAPAKDIFVALNTGTNHYGFMTGTSFASPMAAAVALRYMERQYTSTGVVPVYNQVFDYLLTRPSATVYDVATTEYWLCRATDSSNPVPFVKLTSAQNCPTGYVGQGTSAWPIYVGATNNESNAKMLYSDMTCP